MQYDRKECGLRISRLRYERDWSQQEAAERLGISVSHYKALESGRKGSSIEMLMDLSVLYQCSLDYLVFGRAATPDNSRIRDELQQIQKELAAIEQIL